VSSTWAEPPPTAFALTTELEAAPTAIVTLAASVERTVASVTASATVTAESGAWRVPDESATATEKARLCVPESVSTPFVAGSASRRGVDTRTIAVAL